MPFSLIAQTRPNSQCALALPNESTGCPPMAGMGRGCWGILGEVEGRGSGLHAITSTPPLPFKLGVDGWEGHVADRTSTDLLSDPRTQALLDEAPGEGGLPWWLRR